MHSSTFRFFLTLMGLIGQLMAISTMIQAQMIRTGNEISRAISEQPDEEVRMAIDSTCIRMRDRFSCLSNVQQKLKNQEALIEYFFTDTVMYILSVSHSAFSLVQREIFPWLRESLEVFRRKLTTADISGLATLGNRLYTTLVAPLRSFLEDKTRLIVIPGVELAGVPFEAFVCDSADAESMACGNLHYMIFDYEIIYNYSPDLWFKSRYAGTLSQVCYTRHPEDNLGQNQQTYAFSGISPAFLNHPTLPSLPGSLKEVNEIGSMFKEMGFNACVLSEQNSHESQVKKIAGQSRILHLATHNYRPGRNKNRGGFVLWGFNRAESVDSLQDGLLTGKEIRELHLNADLIVLNACSSGIDFAHSITSWHPQPLNFIRAGARNIISSLWNINDILAGRFMVGFYRNWFEGLPYSAALRKTKLEMLCNPETSLPTVWAPYIIVGH